MEAIIFDGETLEVKFYKDWLEPQIVRPNDVKVKVAYSGVCGTDLHIIKGEFPATKEKKIPMGHEFDGLVVDVGSESLIKKGQRVAVNPNRPCHKCDFCRGGKYQVCLTAGINDTIGIFRDGGWAQYCVVPDTDVYPLPDDVSLEQGGLCEPYSCVCYGWDRASPITIGSKILVLGSGIIGNIWVTMLHLQGHRDVTVSEMSTARLELVKNLETGYRLTTPDVIAEENTLYNVVVDCTGSTRALEASLSLTNHGGKYVLFGCCAQNEKSAIIPFDLYNKELTIVSVKLNPYSFVKAIHILKTMGERYLNYERLGVKTYKLSEYEKAFDDLKAGVIAKAMFKLE